MHHECQNVARWNFFAFRRVRKLAARKTRLLFRRSVRCEEVAANRQGVREGP